MQEFGGIISQGILLCAEESPSCWPKNLLGAPWRELQSFESILFALPRVFAAPLLSPGRERQGELGRSHLSGCVIAELRPRQRLARRSRWGRPNGTFCSCTTLPFHLALDLSVLSCICITAASLVRSRGQSARALAFPGRAAWFGPWLAPQSSGLCRRERHRVGALGNSIFSRQYIRVSSAASHT